MALNRTGKGTALLDESPPKDISINSINLNTIEKPKLSKSEIERGKQDIETINSDLQLLSTLLGRPVSAKDLPKITQQFGGGRGTGRVKSEVSPTAATTTTSTTTTTTTTSKPAILREVELLQTILKTQQNNVKPAPPSEYYGKTDDAILATILKQQGIGPTHNNIPIEVSFILVNLAISSFFFIFYA